MHTTSECTLPFLRQGPVCQAKKAEQYLAWKVRDSEYKAQQAEKALRRKLRGDSARCSVASSDAGSTCADTVTFEEYEAMQAARCDAMLKKVDKDAKLALSEAEEREARKIEKKLRDIARLQVQLDQGKSLDRLQLDKIKSKDSLQSLLVMQKIRAGAIRPSIGN